MSKPYVRKTWPSPLECCEHAAMESLALHRRLEAGPPLPHDALLRSVAEQATLISQALAALRSQTHAKGA